MNLCTRFAIAFVLAACALAAPDTPVPAGPITVAQDGSGDFNGDTADAVRQAVDKAQAQGGGVVVIKPGVYTLRRALDLSSKQNVTLLGEDAAILRAADQQVAVLAQDVNAGDKALVLDKVLDLPEGVQIEIHSDGRRAKRPSGSVFVVPYIMGHVARVDGHTVHLSRPIRYPAAKGKTVVSALNGIVVRGKAKNITIQHLTLDMNRGAWPIVPKNHTYHCALIAGGAYSYEKGPTGPPVEGLRLVDCTIANAHQRGVAFYSVTHSGVYSCRIENTSAEGIDFDHFAYHCEAVGNTLVNCRNIELNDASHCLIANNRVVNASVGIVVWQWCKLPGLNERNLILNNEVVDSKGDGICLRAGADFNLVAGNTVTGSANVGIYVQGERNVIAGNTATGNKKHDIQVVGKQNVEMRNRCSN